jgi:hypothetical protein
MIFFPKRLVLHPEDNRDLAYWTRKWGVNVKQIDNAILESGSVRLADIEHTLRKNGDLGKAWYWLRKQYHTLQLRWLED